MISLPLASVSAGTLERRAKPRIECNYPAVVRAYGSGGKKFEERVALTNLSAKGLYLQTHRSIALGSELIVLVSLSRVPRNGKPAGLIAMLGPVVRSEILSDGRCGVAIKLEKHRFL